MESPVPRPETINKLRFAADAAFAMLAGMQLDVFTPLQAGPKTAEEIAHAIGVGPARLRLLLYSLVAAGLLNEQDGRFSNTPEASHFLVKGIPSYMGDCTQPSHRWAWGLKLLNLFVLGCRRLRSTFPILQRSNWRRSCVGLTASTVAATRSLLAWHDFSSIKTLADVGCGGAGVAMTITQDCPPLQVTAIDLPQITPITQKIVNEEGATDRVKVLAADVLNGPLPGSYDAVILRALIQVFSPEDARLAVKNIGAAINPGGKIYIIGQILDDSRQSPPEAVGFNLNFINTFDAGESYTEQEYREWLSKAGFVDIERANFMLADGNGLMTARKPR